MRIVWVEPEVQAASLYWLVSDVLDVLVAAVAGAFEAVCFAITALGFEAPNK